MEWGDGYYNGDIKTRKTVQSMELNADQMGFQRKRNQIKIIDRIIKYCEGQSILVVCLTTTIQQNNTWL